MSTPDPIVRLAHVVGHSSSPFSVEGRHRDVGLVLVVTAVWRGASSSR